MFHGYGCWNTTTNGECLQLSTSLKQLWMYTRSHLNNPDSKCGDIHRPHGDSNQVPAACKECFGGKFFSLYLDSWEVWSLAHIFTWTIHEAIKAGLNDIERGRFQDQKNVFPIVFFVLNPYSTYILYRLINGKRQSIGLAGYSSPWLHTPYYRSQFFSVSIQVEIWALVDKQDLIILWNLVSFLIEKKKKKRSWLCVVESYGN